MCSALCPALPHGLGSRSFPDPATPSVSYVYNPWQFAEQPQWARKFMVLVVPYVLVAAAYAVDFGRQILSGRLGRALGMGFVIIAVLAQARGQATR